MIDARAIHLLPTFHSTITATSTAVTTVTMARKVLLDYALIRSGPLSKLEIRRYRSVSALIFETCHEEPTIP